jgi:hypothetical protein
MDFEHFLFCNTIFYAAIQLNKARLRFVLKLLSTTNNPIATLYNTELLVRKVKKIEILDKLF